MESPTTTDMEKGTLTTELYKGKKLITIVLNVKEDTQTITHSTLK